MNIRKFAFVSGVILLAMGVLALVPAFSQSRYLMPAFKLQTGYGYFLGLFPMNILNKLTLIGFGVAGIMTARSELAIASVKFSRWMAIVMGGAAVLGIFPQTNTLFGYWPLFGGEVLLHTFFALTGAYFGYVVPSRVLERSRDTQVIR